jgi:hypothetical protein
MSAVISISIPMTVSPFPRARSQMVALGLGGNGRQRGNRPGAANPVLLRPDLDDNDRIKRS